jgi:hypothetical protein
MRVVAGGEIADDSAGDPCPTGRYQVRCLSCGRTEALTRRSGRPLWAVLALRRVLAEAGR